MSKSLHRRLSFRLALGALLIGLLAGGATFYIEVRGAEKTLASFASQEAAAFSEISPGTQSLERQGQIESLLEIFLATHRNRYFGHFLTARIYDPDRREVAKAEQNLPEGLERRIETDARRFPADGNLWHKEIVLGKQTYLQVLVPLLAADGKPAGTFEGIYAVAPEKIRAVSTQIVTTTALTVLMVILTTLALYPLIIHLHREQEQLSRDLLLADLETLSVLGSAVAKRDSDTQAHNFRVTLYALGLAERKGLSRNAICELIKGSWLHDVGKIAISDAILLKPGKLTPEEFAVMKTHVHHGLDILGDFPWLQSASKVVGSHHERWDGSGYPQGLAGEDIPLNARIFALADVFDALTSRRPYKEQLSAEDALKIMAKDRGSHFDPQLYDLFAATVMEDYRCFGGREDDFAQKLLIERQRPYFFDD